MHLYQGNVNLFLVKSITVCYHHMAQQQYLQCFAYMIEHLYFFKLFVLAKYDDKLYQI